MKMSIFDLSLKELEDFSVNSGGKKFNAKQIMKWIYNDSIYDFNKMTDISKAFREKLIGSMDTALPEIMDSSLEYDSNGRSIKYLLRLKDGEAVESVFMDRGKRKTLCVSSQVGCKMQCVFCTTGNFGFKRNLTSGEILAQLLVVKNKTGDKISNVVFMGMGEPLDNFGEVKKALDIISDVNFIGIAPRRITISTCGIMNRLSEILNGSKYRYKIAISLNAVTNSLRDQLMPVNKKFPIESIVETVNRTKPSIHNKITIEYILIKDINDHTEDAKGLIKLFSPRTVKFNIIPFNMSEIDPDINYERSDDKTANEFKNKLIKAGFTVTLRHSRAQSINGGCGQLKSKNIKNITAV